MRHSLMVLILVLFSSQCIGRATPPEQVKLTQQQNEVLGKFARRVGEKEINILLKDPNDTTLPGMPVGDLLYILSKVNEDKLIDLVKGIGATTTLELILAIKRVGCTRVNNNPNAGAYTFDATAALNATNGLNSCKWNHFHLPNIMVQLLNGVNSQGLQTLIDTVKHTYTLPCASNPAVIVGPPVSVPVAGNLATNQALCPATTLITTQPATNASADTFNTNAYKSAVDHYSFLMKIAYIAAGFDYPNHAADPNFASETLPGPAKLYNLMNLTNDGRDMVFLLDSFDKGACPGRCVSVSATNILTTTDGVGNLWTDIQNNDQFLSLRNLLSIIDQVQDTSKMGIIVNGYRPLAGRYDTSYDSAQIRYYIDRLKAVLEHDSKLTKPAACYDATPGTLYNTVSGTAGERQLQDYDCPQGGSAGWNSKLAKLINLISLANTGRMMDLIYYVDDGFDINHVSVTTSPGRGLDNLMVMLNNLNDTALHINNMAGYNPPYTNLTSCSTLLFPAYANDCNNELITAAYLIDYIALDTPNNNPAKRNKVKYLVENIGNTLSVLQLSCYTAVADNNPVGAATCANRGLINLVADGSKLTDTSAVDLTAAGQKLASLMEPVNGVADIEDMRFLIRNVSMANLSAMIKGLRISGTAKTAGLINQISGSDCWSMTQGVMRVLDGGTGLAINPATGIGTGYVNPPTVTFSGGGAGATARAIIETDSSRTGYQTIKDIIILTHGTGYVGGTVTFTGGGGVPPGSAPANVVGNCYFSPPTAYRGFPSTTATGATGLGKMVNIINHITGSPKTVVDLINGVNDGQKLGILINGIGRSSNLVGVMNATLDSTRQNNATLSDMVALIEGTSRTDTHKLVHLIDNVGNAIEANVTDTAPSGDHDLIAQLLSPYNSANIATTSGLGSNAMVQLVRAINLTSGGGLSNATLSLNGGGGAGATGQVTIDNAGAITEITVADTANYPLVHPGGGCTSAPTITVTGGGGAGAQAVAVMGPDTGTPLPVAVPGTFEIQRINIINGGSGYTGPFEVTVSGGGCVTPPRAWAVVNGIGSISVTNAGSNYTNSFNLTITGAGATNASARIIVSGTLAGPASLTNMHGGTGYVANQSCPIIGAGGTGGVCHVQETGGGLTGCAGASFSGGTNYASGRIVRIDGAARAQATVAGGVVTAVTPLNGEHSGCGYGATPVVQVHGCTTAPTVTANAPVGGRITGYSVVFGGTGCPLNPKISVGETPYVVHSDGASAIIGETGPTGITAGTGRVSSVSLSEAAVNMAQLLTLVDRDGSGQGKAITVNAADPATTGASTREAFVRLMHHGVTPLLASGKSYYNATQGVGGPADIGNDGLANGNQSAGNYLVNWPGVGPQHIAAAILNNLNGQSTQTLINVINADSIDLVDTTILVGCGDQVSYSNGIVPFTWEQLCREVGPGIW